MVSEKQRLFVDIDGTLAVFKPVDTLETLYEEGYFINLPPHDNVVEAVKNIIDNNDNIEVFIMSSVLSDSEYALFEKNEWVDKYLPQIDANHRIFPPCGKDKKDYVPEGVRPNDFLLDDYTNNLTLWQPPAKGIKLLNGINNTKGTWQYDRLDYRKSGDMLADNIVSIMTNGAVIKDISLRKEIDMDSIEKTDMSNSNRFALLQLRQGDESTHYKSYRRFEDLKEAPTGNDYEMVYFEVSEPNVKLNLDTDDIFSRFNSDTLRPNNYYGHSMSVSDVLLVGYEGKTEAYYCDDFGFKKLDNEFLTEKLQDDFKHGFDIRKEYEYLASANITTGLSESEMNRLSSIDENYLPIFEMADKRAVILNNQDRLKAIREYELQGGEAFNNGITDQNIGNSTVYFKASVFRENSSKELENLVNERFNERIANMRTNEDELSFPEAKSYKYYSIHRPISMGTYPTKDHSEDILIENYDTRTYVESIGREAWGELKYNRPLSAKEISDYELVADPSIKLTLDERLQGDELFNAKDTISEIANAGGEVDIYGNVIVYHRTDPKMKERIEKTGVMIAKEDGLFFSTKEKGQNEGYGEAVVKLAIPVEKLVIDDFFGDEIHFRYPLENTRRLNISDYLLKDSNIREVTHGEEVFSSLSREIYDFYNTSDEADIFEGKSENEALQEIEAELSKDNGKQYREDIYDYVQSHLFDLSDSEKEKGLKLIIAIDDELESKTKSDFENSRKPLNDTLKEIMQTLVNTDLESNNSLSNDLRESLKVQGFMVDENNNVVSEPTEKFKYFYSGQQDKEADNFQKMTGWHKIWGSDFQGLNGDTWIVYRDVSDLPKYLQDYAIGQEQAKVKEQERKENTNAMAMSLIDENSDNISITLPNGASYDDVATEKDRVKDVTIDNNRCVIVDVWNDIGTAYMVGQSLEEPNFYYATVRENNEHFNFEYDKKPTREDVENDYINRISERELNRHEAEYGADGSKSFPHLNDLTKEELKEEIALQEQTNINLFKQFQYRLQDPEMQPLIQEWREGSSRLKDYEEQLRKIERTEREEYKSDFTLHIKYKEPVEINGWKSETDTITFSTEDELQEYIKGNATYDYLDNSVKKTDNEILLYAEKQRTGEKVWVAENNVAHDDISLSEKLYYGSATITKLALNDYAVDNSFGVRSAYFDTLDKAKKAIDEIDLSNGIPHITNSHIVASIKGIEFYAREDNPNLIMTYNENYHIEKGEDVHNACQRIFDNYYAEDYQNNFKAQAEEWRKLNNKENVKETFDYGLSQDEIDDRNARFEHDDEQDSIRREQDSFYSDLKKEIDSQENSNNLPHGEEEVEKNNSLEAPRVDPEKSLEEQKSEALYRGITSVMDSTEFKNYCDSMNKLMYNNYSPTNCGKILMQWVQRYCDEQKIDVTKLSSKELGEKITEALKSENKPSYLMGYEAWKQYGRQVTGKGVAYAITAPNYVSEYGGKGSLLKAIKKSFNSQFEKNNSLEYARFQLGVTGLSFNGYKNGLMDIVMNGTVVRGKQTEELVRRFLDTEVIGKMPNGYSTTLVYDVKNTVEPEFLWVKNGYTKDELALDDKGEPITRKPYKNSNAVEYKIINTEERKSKFNPHISQDIKDLDDKKMSTLFEVLQKVSENKGVPMTVEPIEEQGTKGFFSQTNNRIVIKDNLSPTEKCAVAFHEMAHADMHYQRKDISREMKEVQAEAVAYMTAQNFGIETSTSSFNYIAIWSKGRDVKELETSMNDILKQSKKLFKEISEELGKRELSLNLEPLNKVEEDKSSSLNDIEKFIKSNKQFVLEEVASVNELKITAKGILHETTDERCSNILKEQIDLCNKAIRKLNTVDKNLNALENTSDDKEVEKLVSKTNKSYAQVLEMKDEFSALTEEYVDRIQEMKSLEKLTLKECFNADPVNTMKDFIKSSSDNELKKLTDKDLMYISKSKYISDNFGRDIKADMSEFMKQAVSQVKNIEQIKSKNGTFVEIAFCEQWGDKPIFENGALAHPTTANKIIEEAEKDIRSMKAEADKAGDYYPYSKCHVTLYTESGDGLIATSTRIDIGDGTQKNLSDHLKQCCRDSSVLEAYSLATRERVKDKIVEPTHIDISTSSQNEVVSMKESIVANTVGMKELKESVGLAQETDEHPQQQSHTQEHSKHRERTKDRV